MARLDHRQACMLCQQFWIAKKLICQCAMISDEPVVLLDVPLAIQCTCTYYSSWKEAIAVLFVHRKLARERGRWRWPANDARTFEWSVFQQKPHNKNLENTIKNPIKLCFWRKNEVSSRFCRNRQTDTHTHRQNDYMCRGLKRRPLVIPQVQILYVLGIHIYTTLYTDLITFIFLQVYCLIKLFLNLPRNYSKGIHIAVPEKCTLY